MSDIFDSQISREQGTILISDSCAGGFGVLRKFLPWAGNFNLIYLADSEFNPFGLKSQIAVNNIVESWIEWAITRNVNLKALVIACNTASIATENTVETMATHYGIPIITMLDGFKMMVRAHSELIEDRVIGLMGTRLTIQSGIYQTIICGENPRKLIDLVATDSERAVAHARILHHEGRQEVKKELSAFPHSSLETIILGCTCFEFIDESIRDVFGSTIDLLNPADYVARKALEELNVRVAVPKKLSEVVMLNTGVALWKRKMTRLSKHIFAEPVSVDTIVIDRFIHG